MKESFLTTLACPACNGGLEFGTLHRSGGEIDRGELRCHGCAATYPIRDSIPRFVPQGNYADSFGLQWNHFSRTQLDSHNGTTISRERFLAQWGEPPDSFQGLRILDVGCGSGRFAEIALSLGAEVVAVDYSAAIDACRRNLAPNPRVEFIQGDIRGLPFKPAQFDRAYCFGVLMATPKPEQSFAGLVSQVRPGGMLVVDQYDKTWKSLLHPKYALRPLTSRIPPSKLLPLIERLAPTLLRISSTVAKVPILGWGLRRLVPVANYEGVYPLNEQQLREWAILDTFDWLSPRYDYPQNAEELRACFERAGFERIEVSTPPRCHLTGRGRKPGNT